MSSDGRIDDDVINNEDMEGRNLSQSIASLFEFSEHEGDVHEDEISINLDSEVRYNRQYIR